MWSSTPCAACLKGELFHLASLTLCLAKPARASARQGFHSATSTSMPYRNSFRAHTSIAQRRQRTDIACLGAALQRDRAGMDRERQPPYRRD